MGRRLDNATALYMEGIRDGNPREAVEKYTADPYEQHSTGVRSGKDGFIEFFDGFLERNPDRQIEIVRGFEDGANVFVQAYQVLNGGEYRYVTADIFDTNEDGKMIEHWDVIQAVPDEIVGKHSMIDGPTEPTDLHLTDDNKELVRRFIEEVLRDGQIDRASDYISTESYAQHNPTIGDGLDPLFVAAEDRDGGLVYRQIHQLVGCGDFVAALSEMTYGGNEMAVIDIFRIADGKIVEHWDVMEPIPTPEQARNSGKF
ncbi:MAG: nuclear transport factor 2 family protein [Actinomycetota bacterium]